MRTKSIALLAGLCLALTMMIGCSQNRAATPSSKENVERSLDQNSLKDVRVDEDRDKGVITLKGTVKSEAAKAQAEDIAKASANGMIVANEISVRPEGAESDARKISGNVDDGIENNLKAGFTANHLDNQHIGVRVKEGVVTLTGDVDTMDQRVVAEKTAAATPNVTQVVNELKVKGSR